MIVDCAHYEDGQRTHDGIMPLAQARARVALGGFAWLALFEPREEELASVRETFGLHELAVEDALIMHRHPKIVSYDEDVQLIVMRTARYDEDAEEVDFGEISVFFAPTFVITVRQGVAGGLQGARHRLEQRPDLLATGSSSALWAILDEVVDMYAPVVLAVEHDVDEIEATVFAGTIAPTERIYSLRREATGFYRAVHPLLAVIAAVEHAAPPELRPYLRDVHDHLLRVDEGIADQRDLLSTVLEANMAVISVEHTRIGVQQNRTIERLTILATVFLPLTAITGFFGMNFEWMVNKISSPPAFLIFGIGSLVVALVLLLSWLRFGMPRAETGTAVGKAAGQGSTASPVSYAATGMISAK